MDLLGAVLGSKAFGTSLPAGSRREACVSVFLQAAVQELYTVVGCCVQVGCVLAMFPSAHFLLALCIRLDNQDF